MEILIDNPLATMYGPYFLILFGFVIFFAVIILALVKAQFDKTDQLGIPAIPPNIDPYEIAFLRGGNNEVARSVVFSLLQKGFIEIDNIATPAVIKKTLNQPDRNNLTQIELMTLGWLGASREPKEFFGAGGLVGQIEVYSDSYQGKLEQQQMLTSDEDRTALNPVKWSVYLIILGLGGYKILAAIANGYFNIFFLIIFTIIGLIIAAGVSKLPRVTKLGKAYLERLQTAFDNLKYTSQRAYIASNQPKVAPEMTFQPKVAPQTSFAGVDPLLLSVGVFGAGILAGTVFDGYNQAFQRAQSASVAGGSSCSSGCGSCSSGGSSCSSGDGGGSSCGGGCGGCGGGGD